MQPIVKRTCLIILLSSLVGGIVSASLLSVILYYFGEIFLPHREITVKNDHDIVLVRDADNNLEIPGSHGKAPSRFVPPVPVSPPLVRPETPNMPPSSHLTSERKVDDVKARPLITEMGENGRGFIFKELPSFAPLVRAVIPAVVNISISHHVAPPSQSLEKNTPIEGEQQPVHKKKKLHHPKHRLSSYHVIRPVEDEVMGAGSGFIVEPTGIIVTNRHVVRGAGQVIVSLSDGRSLAARVLGADPMTDIAVIKVESPTALPCVKWGDSRQVEIGDWILVAGNPFGFGSSVTAGIISAVGRDLGIGALDDFMQLDAPINPGNSGGPAFNLHGEVVAVNAAIASPSDGSVGIGFGIPAEIVAPIVSEIEKTGHVEHGWLGVSLNDLVSPMWVEDVDHNGPAWQGGLRPGDAILEMGHVPVHDARTVLRSVAVAHPGTVFIFTIRRHGEVKTLSITLGKRPLSAGD